MWPEHVAVDNLILQNICYVCVDGLFVGFMGCVYCAVRTIYIFRFIDAPYSSPSTSCSYQQDKRAKPGNPSKLNAVVEIGEHYIKSTFAFFSP